MLRPSEHAELVRQSPTTMARTAAVFILLALDGSAPRDVSHTHALAAAIPSWPVMKRERVLKCADCGSCLVLEEHDRVQPCETCTLPAPPPPTVEEWAASLTAFDLRFLTQNHMSPD